MNALQGLKRLFQLALVLYPVQYRADFAEERLAVFDLAASEAAGRGRAALLAFGARELVELPGAALAAHVRWGRWTMIASIRTLLAVKPDRWGNALLAGLPHLLFAVCYYLPVMISPVTASTPAWMITWHKWLTDFPLTWAALLLVQRADYWLHARVFFQSVAWVWGLSVLAVTLAGWRLGWPRWSASWLGYALIVILQSLITLFPQDVPSFISICIWLVMACAIYAWQTARSPLHGLLALLPFYPMFTWWLAADGIIGTYSDMAAYVGAAALMTAAVALMARTGSTKLALILLAGLLLLGGGGFAYATTYHSNAPDPSDPYPGEVVRGILFYFLGMLIFSAPVWGATIWRARRKRLST